MDDEREVNGRWPDWFGQTEKLQHLCNIGEQKSTEYTTYQTRRR